MSSCFAPLLGWVLRLWRSQTRRLPLVMDPPRWAIGFPIVALSVVLSGCAIPGGLKVPPAEQPGSWRPFLRINGGSTARLAGEDTFEWLSRWVAHAGHELAGPGSVFCQHKRAGAGHLAAATSKRGRSRPG